MAISVSPVRSDKAKAFELLVSAASMEEFDVLAAVDEVDIIDLKNPTWGAISPVSADLWDLVAATSQKSGKHQQLSAALGEFDQAVQCVQQLPPEFRFAKMGSSECESSESLQQRWQKMNSLLNQSTELVAVAYADFASAKSIDPISILVAAEAIGLKRILIDTFNKDGRSSIDHLGVHGIEAFAGFANRKGIWWSLAGTINLSQIDQLISAKIYPDCIGVRGAVCEAGRATPLSKKKCRRFGQSILHLEK